MADILLLEPGYSNKYPPIGLMKISYFHKYIHGDYVRFAKGRLPEAFKDKKWDRVYVTTLFTFEWEKTKETLEYALSVVKDPYQVYTGGILATLIPNLIAENFPTVKNNIGLLDKKGTLGLAHEECIDRMTLDYGILDDIADQYVYPAHDAYFTYMTRGCGMKCEFCAVQTLEPEYYPYISIKETVRKVDETFGPKKDLLLMDNNVLRSPNFDQIIDEIIELGFGKGATYVNPKTGKTVRRYVDFNQGLDAFLMTEHKAKRLGEIAIRPARIAFDHVEDKEAYKKAIRLCAENGITHMSNYLLYNGEEFKGKGHSYHADTPEDLYERMQISMNLQEELCERLDHKVAIFSFPMRYIPLSDLKRGFVGTNWNMKYLRALQRMLIPTQGKGVSSRSFFEADMGKTQDDFVRFLAMPEEHLGWRGDFLTKKGETPEDKKHRREIWMENQKFINEWNRLFFGLGDTKKDFIDLIGDNVFSTEKYEKIENELHRKLFIHYFTHTSFLKALLLENEAGMFMANYIHDEFPLMYKRMIEYIVNRKLPYSLLAGPIKTYKEKFVQDVLEKLNYDSPDEPFVLNNLIKIQKSLHLHIFPLELVRCIYMYNGVGLLNTEEKKKIVMAVKKLDERKTRKLLLSRFDDFRTAVIKTVVDDEVGAQYIIEQIENQLNDVYKQMTIWDCGK